MSVDERERERRIQQLIRDNNRKFRGTALRNSEQKEQQFKQKAYEYFSAEEEKERMKEFGKKVQEENLKRTLLAKEAKKVCDALTQKKAEEERKKKKRRQEQKKQVQLKVQLIKTAQQGTQLVNEEQSRVSMTPEELLDAERRIVQKAQQELRRIKEAKRQARADQEKRQSKLQQLEIRRKNILERTRKVPQGGVQPLHKENAGATNNIGEDKELLKKIEQQTLREIEILNSLIKQASGREKSRPKISETLQHSVIPEHTEEDCSDEDEEDDGEEELPRRATSEEGSSSSHEDQNEYTQPNIPHPIGQDHLNYDMSFNKLIQTGFPNAHADLSSDDEFGPEDDIFRLSSAQLMSKPYLRI